MYKRGGVWYIRVAGIRQSSGTASRKDAEALESKLNHDHWLAERMGQKPPRSWQETVVRYLKECQGQASYTYKVGVLKEWAGLLKEPKDIRLITRDVIDGLLEPTVEPSAHNSTLNHKTSILHHMLRKACEEWDWIERTPKFRMYPRSGAKEKHLTPTQVHTLLDSLPTDLTDFCSLALATGLRSGALVKLSWSQFDPQRRILTVSGRGNKRANPIPLNQTAMAVLEARRRASTVHLTRVFPEFNGPPVKQRWHTFQQIRKIPGLEGVGIHTLRHTFNTWLANAGVSEEVRKYLMGHSRRDTHAIYTHWADTQLRPAVAVIDRILEGDDGRSEARAG